MSAARKVSPGESVNHLELELSRAMYDKFTNHFYDLSGVSLPYNDKNDALVKNRLIKLLRRYQLSSYEDFWSKLQQNQPVVVSEFISALTTNMTSFFRESTHFDWLAQYLPQHFKQHRELRFWCAAASTGQEPYTISLVLHENLTPDQLKNVKFLATDIDLQVLNKGSQGIYSEKEISGLPANLQKKYFPKSVVDGETLYKAETGLRKLIRFAPLNLVQDKYGFEHQFDIIICRNVLIYFDLPTTQKVIANMTDQLKVGGHLILGHSESGNVKHPALQPLSRAIYKKK